MNMKATDEFCISEHCEDSSVKDKLHICLVYVLHKMKHPFAVKLSFHSVLLPNNSSPVGTVNTRFSGVTGL